MNKTERYKMKALTLLIIVLVTSSMVGADYSISWYTIDGGGGTSSGGPYQLTGTIGQPDADWCSGGEYEVLGGFWPGGPLCFVEFDDFARFAEHWWLKGIGADLNEDTKIDFKDMSWFTDFWLEPCPSGWQLK